MAEQIIKTYVQEKFGFSPKEEQLVAIIHFVAGKDVFVPLPTSYGKTVCYGALPGIFDQIHLQDHSIIVVVSPTKSLIEDHMQSFNKVGLTCAYVGDTQLDRKLVHHGGYQIVFMSPELLLARKEWRDMIKNKVYQKRLVGFIVDEVHCVKQW